MFLKRGEPYALVVGMAGVKMGDRFLQIGCADGGRLAAIAQKVGLSDAPSRSRPTSRRPRAREKVRRTPACSSMSRSRLRRDCPSKTLHSISSSSTTRRD